MRKVTLLAALLLLTPSVSQAKTLEDLLVDKGVITKGEAAGATSASASKVYWNNGTRVDFPDNGFTFGVNTLIQTRYTFTDRDEADNTSGFEVTKARLIVSGTALHEEFSYFLQEEFAGNGGSSLRDAFLTWHACDWVDLKMGQFKTPTSRGFLVPDYKQQFADEAATSQYFNLGRSQGLYGSTKVADGVVSLGAGIFNGKSDNELGHEGINSRGVDTKHTGVLNVRANALGTMDPFEEGDIGWTEDPALNVGATYAYTDGESGGADADGFTQDNIDLDLNFKFTGWSVHGEYFYQVTDPDAGEKDEPQGFYTQVGYFVVPKELEVAVRYGLIDCDNGSAAAINPGAGTYANVCAGNDKVNQVTVGLNYFFWKHNLKAQLNYDHLNERVTGDGDDLNTNRWLLQLSSFF